MCIRDSGSAAQVTSASNSRTGHLVHLASTSTNAGATGDVLHVKSSTTTNTAMIANFANNTTNVLSVMVGGGVKIDGDLDVTGTTTQFRTAAAVVNDKTLVLGAVGDVRTGATYSVANPAVVTSTAHGLNDGQVIFVVASSGTSSGTVGVPSEELFTVANKTTNTFEIETIDGNLELEAGTVTGTATGYLVLDGTDGTAANAGDNILMSEGVDATGDSNRTFSWVGPQTDAAVDDAGLVVPGSSAKHFVKWDDTDNYWKLNDSLMVQSSGQFVFPKGTTADKPGASATSTLAAATVGAMRFNTTLAKFEGVSTGTTYENMSTEAFSVAVSIALG